MVTTASSTSHSRRRSRAGTIASLLRACLFLVGGGLTWSCAGILSRLPGSRDQTGERAVPPDLRVRRSGRWTCGAEIPQGRAVSTIDLLHHSGPGHAWRLVVDADRFAQLQLIERHGRARQGCWAELEVDEIAALERTFRDAGLCDRPEEPRAPATEGAFEVSIALSTASCTRHVAGTSGRRGASDRRLAEETQRWLDRVSDGSFRRVESFATSAADRSPPRAPVTRGRLTCGADRGTLYAPGDTWLLEYSFQRGLLWRRGLEVSRDGAVAIDLASFQNGAHQSCTGHLTDAELTALGEGLADSRPCALKTASSPASEDHGYLSVHHAGMDCRYLALRGQDLLDSREGRRLDQLVTSLARDLLGPGAVDPFDARTGLLFEGRVATSSEKLATMARPARRASR